MKMNKVLSALYGFCAIVSSVVGMLILCSAGDHQQGILFVILGVVLSTKADTVDERKRP